MRGRPSKVAQHNPFLRCLSWSELVQSSGTATEGVPPTWVPSQPGRAVTSERILSCLPSFGSLQAQQTQTFQIDCSSLRAIHILQPGQQDTSHKPALRMPRRCCSVFVGDLNHRKQAADLRATPVIRPVGHLSSNPLEVSGIQMTTVLVLVQAVEELDEVTHSCFKGIFIPQPSWLNHAQIPQTLF